LIAAMIVFAALWWFYGRQTNYLVIAIIFLLLLIFDYQIHRLLVAAREKSEKSKKLGAEIKILEKKRADAIAAGATKSEIAALQRELNDLIKEKSKL
jgi:hypothetical protein